MLTVSSCLGVIYDDNLFCDPLLNAQKWFCISRPRSRCVWGWEWGALCFLAGISEALLLKCSVMQFSLVLLGQLGFVGPGKKLFPSLSWRSCSSNLPAALRWAEELLVWAQRSRTGRSGAVLFQPQTLESWTLESKHTKRLQPSCFICCDEEVDARMPPGFCFLLELCCGSSTSSEWKLALVLLYPCVRKGYFFNISPFFRHFWAFLAVCVCVFLCMCMCGVCSASSVFSSYLFFLLALWTFCC